MKPLAVLMSTVRSTSTHAKMNGRFQSLAQCSEPNNPDRHKSSILPAPVTRKAQIKRTRYETGYHAP